MRIKSIFAGIALACLSVSSAFAADNAGPWVETTTPVLASATYTGTSHYLIAAGSGTGGASFFGGQFYADRDGTAYIDSSNDGTTWTVASTKALTATHTVDLNVPLRASYYRVRFVNGGADQGAFRVFAAQTQSGAAGQTTDGAGAVGVSAGSGTIVDGAIATLGSKTDAKSTATDSTSVSAMQVLKQISASAQAGTANTGSSVPTGAIYAGANSGGNLTGIIQAGSSAKIDISTATTTQLVALSSGKKIYVTNYKVVAGGTGNFKFVYGTGSNCGTGTTDLEGNNNLTAQAGASVGSGLGPVLVVPASNALCATTSAAVQMSGHVAYTQF